MEGIRLTICVLTLVGIGLIASLAIADDRRRLDAATVSFGQWQTDPPLDRLTANPAGGAGNNHEVIPSVITIEAGGAVNFATSGLHNVVVYDDGTQPEDISTANPLPGAAGGIIDDANKRVYRGFDPNLIPNNNQRDRVEVLHFPKPGTYLVICGVVNHFVNDRMFGFVEVKKDRHRRW
jgi:plastocyanin